MKNRVKSVFFEVINLSATSMCSNNIKVTLDYSVCVRTSCDKVLLQPLRWRCVEGVLHTHPHDTGRAIQDALLHAQPRDIGRTHLFSPRSWSQHHFVAIGNPERHVRKPSHCGSK